MSEFLSEASVLIRPDTTKFRTLLEAELIAATRGVVVPIPVTATPVATGAARNLAVEATATATALRAQAVEAQLAGAAAAKASVGVNTLTASEVQLRKGVIASAASLTGLRGAVLAASTPFLAAAIGVTAFAKAVGSAAALEQELNVFQVTAGATADQMGRVSEAAKALGSDISLPSVSAGDAAKTFTELAKAGLSVQDALAGGRGVLELATAAQLDFGQAAELTASALNAFQLSGDQAVHVADLLANASNEAQGSIADMGLSLQQAAAVADQVGLSLDETVTFITLLARAGLRGSDAGTSLRVALTRLISPTKDANAAIERLGINLRDANGNIRPDIFVQFGDALDKVTKEERDRINVTIFGTDAQRAAAILERTRSAALDQTTAALERAGAAQELAGARAKGFSGELNALGSNLETLGTTLGAGFLPPLKLVVIALNDLVSAANAVPAALGDIKTGLDAILPDLLSFQSLDFFGDAALGADAFSQGSQDLVDSLGLAAFQLSRVQKELAESSDSARILGDALNTEISGKGPNEAAAAIQDLIDHLDRSDPAIDKLAKKLEGILRLTQALGRTPTLIEIKTFLNEGQIRQDVKTASQIIIDGFAAALSPEAAHALGLDFMEGLGAGITDGSNKIQNQIQLGPTPIHIIEGPAEKLLNAQIADDRSQELKILQNQKKAAEAAIAAGIQDKDLRLKKKAELDRINREIEAIEADIAADRQKSQSAIDKLRSDADQKIIDAIAGGEQKRRNAALAATTTDSLKDDIAAQTALRNFFKSKIAQVRKTVQDAKTAASEIASLTADFISANLAIADLEKRQADALKAQRRAVIERRRENLELNLQIAQATGNKGAQKRALNAQIAEIEDEIRATRRGSLERKRLILELRQAQASLRDLKKEKDKTKKSTLAAREFEFLQTQQGFVSNLLSNLIPQGATAGLVGSGSGPVTAIQGQRPQQAVAQERTAAQGTQLRGATAGQLQTTNDKLEKILKAIQALNQNNQHPEAKHQRKVGSAIMDNVGGV